MTCRDIYRNFYGMTTNLLWGLIFAFTFGACLAFKKSLIVTCCALGLEVICYFLLSLKNYRKKIIKRTKKHFNDIADVDRYIDDVVQDINENLIGFYRNRFILSKHYVIICDDFGPVAVPRDRIHQVTVYDAQLLYLYFEIAGKKHAFTLGKNTNLSQGAAEKLLEYLGFPSSFRWR